MGKRYPKFPTGGQQSVKTTCCLRTDIIRDTSSPPITHKQTSSSDKTTNKGGLFTGFGTGTDIAPSSDTSSGLSDLVDDHVGYGDPMDESRTLPGGLRHEILSPHSMHSGYTHSTQTSNMSLATVTSFGNSTTVTTCTDYQQPEPLPNVEYQDPGSSQYLNQSLISAHPNSDPSSSYNHSLLSKSLDYLSHAAEAMPQDSALPSNSDPEMSQSHNHSTDMDDGFATYPPPKTNHRNKNISSGHDKELITRLMITHSGDRIPPDGAESEPGSYGNKYSSRMTSNVTVPEPTSFHLHGNNVGKHFLSPEQNKEADPQLEHHARVHYKPRSGFRMGVAEPDTGPIDYTNFEYVLPPGCKHPLPQRVALDKEAQRYMLYYTWSSSSAKKQSSRHRHLRRIKHDPAAEDSDSSGVFQMDPAIRASSHRESAKKHVKTKSAEVIGDVGMFCRSRNSTRSRSLGHLSLSQSGWCIPDSNQPKLDPICSTVCNNDQLTSVPNGRHQFEHQTMDFNTIENSVSEDPDGQPVSHNWSATMNLGERSIKENSLNIEDVDQRESGNWTDQAIRSIDSSETINGHDKSEWVSCYVDVSTQSTSTQRPDQAAHSPDWQSGHSVDVGTQSSLPGSLGAATPRSDWNYRVLRRQHQNQGPHSSDGDTESLYQDYEEYEESLIRYVKPEDLCQANENIKSLYRAQLDGSRALTVLDTPSSLLQRLTCCFICQSQRSSLSGPSDNPPPDPTDSKPKRQLSRSLSRTVARIPSKVLKTTQKKQEEALRRRQEIYSKVKIGRRHSEQSVDSGNHNTTSAKGNPITQTIMDAGSAAAFGDGLKYAGESERAEFTVDTQGRKGNLDVQVDGPNSIAKVNISPGSDGKYLVTYIPVEVGIYNVNIRWNGKHIEGSPYRPRVVSSRKVIPVGGWEAILDNQQRMHLRANQRNRIEFDTMSAGPGEMRAEVKGPEGAVPVDVEGGNGRHAISFIPRTAGDYFIKVFWGDVCLSRCPILASAMSENATLATAAPTLAPPPTSTHDKVVLTGHGLVEARVQEEAEFVIDGTEAGSGSPEVKLAGVKADIPVRVIPLGGDKYKCVYSPLLAGAYLLSIMWAERQVRGSPFKVNVMASSDASKVSVSGEGIRGGIFGKEIKAVIDTRRAGPGELTAHCMGPQKVAYCELYDHRDGTFTLNIKPQESGKHLLQVKYGGEHVPGSPFVLRVAGAPDASKVRVSGPGVEHGILANYQSRFITETRGAGAGQLTVRIRGPKGAFRVEMSRESQKDRTILCRYDPTEVGDYIISVKWSGEHVPGSPFQVQIFDTNDELERFLHMNPARRQNAPAMPDRRWSEDL